MDYEMLVNAVLGFIFFCLLSGAVYVINDIKDLESDRQHPRKKYRPIAAGDLPLEQAAILAVLLVVVALAGSFSINLWFGIIALAYFILQVTYSLFLKHLVIVDILTVAIGFVLRALAGIEAIRIEGAEIPVTPWFIMVTFFLALFIIICKRRHELMLLEKNASDHRPVLEQYSASFIDQMISVVTSATIISYALWTTIGYKGQQSMIYTLPFVVYGIFRYLYIAYKKKEGGAPEIVLLTDIPILIDVILWGIAVLLLVYIGK
jgi:4-hydroxybenzoate polyprenyltransferase